MLLSDQNSRRCHRVRRHKLKPIQDPHRPHLSDTIIKKALGSRRETLTIDHFGWKKCFPETRDLPDKEIKAKLLSRIAVSQKEILDSFRKEKTPLTAKKDLSKASLLRQWIPKKFGRKMICISSDVDLRRSYIRFYKALADQAVFTLSQWRKGNLIQFPLGLFPPSMPRVANAVSLGF